MPTKIISIENSQFSLFCTSQVKEKLRIFEPNWMNTKKVHYPKKYVAYKHINGINSKNVTNLREKYQENEDCIPTYASKVERLKQDKQPTKTNVSVNKPIVSKPLEKIKSDIEKPNIGQKTGSKTTNEDIPKKSQKNPQPSVENQSMIFNFSKRKEIPSHLPDVSNLDDKSLTVVRN